MSQRTDERIPTDIELDCYNKYEQLFAFTIQVCCPDDKNGKTINNHHICKRHRNIANKIIEIVCEIGALIVQGNYIYVGSALKDREVIIKNFQERIDLQNKAYNLTFGLENYIRSVNVISPLANNTLTHWVDLMMATRECVKGWRDSNTKRLREYNRAFVDNTLLGASSANANNSNNSRKVTSTGGNNNNNANNGNYFSPDYNV